MGTKERFWQHESCTRPTGRHMRRMGVVGKETVETNPRKSYLLERYQGLSRQTDFDCIHCSPASVFLTASICSITALLLVPPLALLISTLF